MVVQDEKSNQLFVNGKPFMDGDTKLDPKISLRMQLIKCKYYETSMKNANERIENNDDIALNIKLKRER
jgi:hypothetical protein